jgi:hypothetical protein
MKAFRNVLIAVVAISLGFGMTGRAVAATTTVDLGTAAPFAILAGSAVTDVPTSVITGNVGLSPAAGTFYSGLTKAEVTGTIYSVNASGPAGYITDPTLLTTAKNDLATAYTDAAGRTPVTIIPTELGGQTLTDGVYGSASTTFGITAGAGPLVLDGGGDSSSVFIFEMNSGATGLTVGPGSTVSLINGASACNVFWRLNTATIDTTAVFKGNILALTSITVANGANIEGRLLARNGNVTLIADTITVPTCAAAAAATATASAGDVSASSASSSAVADAGLPSTGIVPTQNNIYRNIFIASGVLILSLASLAVVFRKRKSAI